jgi:hypothetical protein
MTPKNNPAMLALQLLSHIFKRWRPVPSSRHGDRFGGLRHDSRPARGAQIAQEKSL